jgi:hypothetical protein
MATEPEEFLWRMYAENTTQGRHHEVQRSNVTGFMLLIGTALIGIMTFDREIAGLGDAAIAAFLMGVGLFGAAFTLKHYERYRLHMTRAKAYRNQLDEMLPGRPLVACKRIADEEHAKTWTRLRTLHTTYWWAALHMLLFLIGAALMVVTLFHDPSSATPSS